MSSYDGKLCKIVKAKANGTLATGTNKSITISQGEASMTLFTRASFAANTVVSNSYYDIIGVPCLYSTTNEIVVVSTDDVVENSITWQLKSIAVKTTPKLSYTEDDTFDPTGLVLSTVVEDASDASIFKAGNDVAYAGNETDFSFDPSLSDELTTANTSVTITYEGKSTTQAITVNPAGGTPKYVKITSADVLTTGQYLIVYEGGSLAFNGGLETLDAVSNTISVTISENIIAQSTAIDAAAFNYDATAKTLKSASGYYIGNTSNSNALSSNTSIAYTNTISFDMDGNADIVSSGGAYLRYNSASNQTRFCYFKSSSYTGQQAIQLYKRVVN